MLKKLGLEGLNIVLKQARSNSKFNFYQHIRLVSSEDDVKNAATNVHNPFAAGKPNQMVQRDPLKGVHDKETKLKILHLEVDLAFQEGRRIPEPQFLKEHHWEHLLTLPSKSARQKYLAYLWQIERKKESRQNKKLEKQVEIVERKAKEVESNKVNNHIIYGISHNTFLLRVYDTTINRLYNSRLIKAMQFGSKIVMDCSYDDHMNSREAANAAKQLMLSFAANRMHDDPFDIHFCNVDMNSITMQSLKRHIPTMLDAEFPLNVHEKCFTELFPKDRLVYLTPHCRTDLESYDPDDVYIIGAMVDKINNEPLSLAKAKRLNIRMARLPLDSYLQWGTGSGKSLTLNQMINIMLDLKSTGSWETSLRHVPRRKIIDEEREQSKEKRILRRRADELKFHLDTWAKSKNRTGT